MFPREKIKVLSIGMYVQWFLQKASDYLIVQKRLAYYESDTQYYNLVHLMWRCIWCYSPSKVIESQIVFDI